MALYLITWLALAAQPGNVLANPDFSSNLESWQRHPGDTRATVLGAPPKAMLRLEVDDTEEVTWRHVFQGWPAAPGQMFRAEAEGRGENIHDGHGLFLSIAFYDADNRRIAHNDTAIQPGLDGWTPMIARGCAPEGTVRAALMLLLHGRGHADFRKVRLIRLPDRAPAPEADNALITVTGDQTCDALIGFGAEDDGWFYNPENAAQGADEAAIALREARIEWMQPDYIRMFFWYNDWNPSLDAETFTWDSPNMRSHYRALDLYQRLGARVNVTGVEWAVKNPWENPEQLAKAIGALLEHLIKTKGYTCVQDWTLSNEPNLFYIKSGESFEKFVRLHQLVAAQCRERGLTVNIVGSDDGDGEIWFARCVNNDAYFEACDLFASHFYLHKSALPFAGDLFRGRVAMLEARTPKKPFIVAEFGLMDERTQPPDKNPYMQEYPYALWSQACFIDGLNAGVAGFVTWCMHEMYYPGGKTPMRFGLWDFGAPWRVRPIYHAVAAFCRNTSAGDSVWRCDSSESDWVKAARVGETLFWVNLAEAPMEIRVEGFQANTVRIMTEDTLEGDRECGILIPFENGHFAAPPKSFGYMR